jgi:hypothetical protein
MSSSSSLLAAGSPLSAECVEDIEGVASVMGTLDADALPEKG